MKSVCVIGAGPGGLVVAKVLLQTGGFAVTVYEQNATIGGIWAFEPSVSANKYLSIDTPGNLSRHTMGFSDLSWDSIERGGRRLPMFPPAGFVGKYLDTYRQRYIPDEIIQFDCRVVETVRLTVEGRHKWQVTTEAKDGKRNRGNFDFLVNAAGFFASPSTTTFQELAGSKVAQLHTSQFRNLKDLFPDPNQVIRGKKILVYGSGNSSAETASSIALQISSSQYSPASDDRERFAGMKVYYVTPRAVYAIPPFVPTGLDSITFEPLDLHFYDMKWRPEGPLTSESGVVSAEKIEFLYNAMHGMVGTQTDLGSDALLADQSAPPYAVLSEGFPEHVRSGLICPITGRLVGVAAEKDLDVGTATVQDQSHEVILDDIVGIVHAVGYTQEPALSFLPQDVKQSLEHDSACHRLPVLLQQHQTINPAVPDLAFIGFYEGPYWPVMEMQARIVAARWAGTETPPESPAESLDKLRELRAAIKARAKDVPQYWYSDYIGCMEETVQNLSLKRLDTPFKGERDGPTSPARYLTLGDNETEASKSMKDLKNTREEVAEGKFRARAAFRALHGKWNVRRIIESSGPGLPSGVFTGTAQFHPRLVTDSEVDFEYLYIENGSFTMNSGMRMSATRRYVYRYREATDTLSVWFVKPSDELSTDYLFHDLEFGAVEAGKQCTAHAEHLCDEDLYVTEYAFAFRTVALERFEIRHHVKGPNKDYVAKAQYTR